MTVSRAHSALACVMGSMDLVRPLGLYGVRCAAVSRPGTPPIYSRFTRTAFCWPDFWENGEALVERLMQFARAEPEPPVLFYEEDAHLLLISRYRERLAQAFRFVIADAELVEDLVDKARFQALAERLNLPVPPTRRIHPAPGTSPAALDVKFPVIVKPLTRCQQWDEMADSHKALEVDSPAALERLWPQLVALGRDVLVQEMIPGPETRIESYHVYVDAGGSIVAEFTGRKIRTYPTSRGHSSAVEISDAADVMAQGRALVRRLALTGVAKFDFKRGPDGRLHLLEINPRFTLWHHVAAIAGVNMPAMVYADLTGLPRPAAARARPGTRWCCLWRDLAAARASGIPLSTWLPWALGCEAKSAMAWDDPMPLVRGMLERVLSARAA